MKTGTRDVHNLPEFFKVYIGDHSFHQLLIPSEFVDYMGRRRSGLAELAGPSGRTWRVELVEDGNVLYFAYGWQAFVRDNLVQDGDFLFFKFHGNLIFSIVIYDETMCEKDGFNRQPRDDIMDIGEEQNGGETESMSSVRTSRPKVRKTAEQTAISVKPSFEKHVTLPLFNIPKSFLREHSLRYESREKMVLRTNRNSFWEVKIITNDDKTRLSGGWSAFVRESQIREGDICKFELLERLEMMVHVLIPIKRNRPKK